MCSVGASRAMRIRPKTTGSASTRSVTARTTRAKRSIPRTKKPQLRALLRRRPEIVDALDRVFGESDVDGGDKFADGELSGFLKALVPLYDKPLETIPTATRGIAQLLAQLIEPGDERAQKVLETVERLSKRTGYRAPNRNLGAVRALFTYPELDKLARPCCR